ncbi:MAG: 2-oxoacid:acceptor oxidoreductase subunit alpha [Candidatus Neomarinimicrobiota bacterium]
MSSRKFDFVIAVGGAAGQGIATPGNILAKIFARSGLYFFAHNAYQSIIRGGHSFLTVRASDTEVRNHGDTFHVLIALNQDTMDRHLKHMSTGTWVIYNSDTIKPGEANDGIQFCPMPVKVLSNNDRNKLVQNTVAIAAVVNLLGMGFETLESVLNEYFKRKGEEVVNANVNVAKAAYGYTGENFKPYPASVPTGSKPLAIWRGNDAIAMGAAAAGVKFYAAYPMSPASGILHWMAQHARDLDIMVRQAEDEISVINMIIGAAHSGCRAMCATSGGGFALMTEAIGSAGMMEIPVVIVNTQRGGPSTGLPTKTEQGDLWQALGASQGDYPRIIVAPKNPLDAFDTIPQLFNLVDKYQCPGILLSDEFSADETSTIDPDLINLQPEIDRGELITEPAPSNSYMRYKITKSGISPRALPGLKGYSHVVATDEQDEDGVLISDEFTNPGKRKLMMEKRMRKMADVDKEVDRPRLEGPESDITLIGWGSTHGVINESIQQLNDQGIVANHLHIKWIVPFHATEVIGILAGCKKTIIVENNYSGLFYRYMRSETGVDVDGHIRKYDGEPFMPHHITDGVKAILSGKTKKYVPEHELLV